jgi:hypothetical protein
VHVHVTNLSMNTCLSCFTSHSQTLNNTFHLPTPCDLNVLAHVPDASC